MSKRMDIVRALAAKPEVLLLDEPFAHIDPETRVKAMRAAVYQRRISLSRAAPG